MTIKQRRTAESQDDESEEESDMGMDVVPIQEHPRTEVQLGLPSDPSTSQVRSHVEFVVPGIDASEIAAYVDTHRAFGLRLGN